MLVAVEEEFSLARVLLAVAQEAVLWVYRSPSSELNLQKQPELQEAAEVVCSSRYWVTAVSKVARCPAEGCSLVVSGDLKAAASLLESTR